MDRREWLCCRRGVGSRWGNRRPDAGSLRGGQLLPGGVPGHGRRRTVGWNAVECDRCGLTGVVNTLAFHDDGSGPALYAAGGVSSGIRRWDGTAWQPVSSGLDRLTYSTQVLSLATARPAGEANPAELWIGGDFTVAGGYPAANVARWRRSCVPVDRDPPRSFWSPRLPTPPHEPRPSPSSAP